MKWLYAIKNKLKAAIVLTFILVLISAKSILDTQNIKNLGRTFISVYEDRLVVENYLFKISEYFFEVRLLAMDPNMTENQIRSSIAVAHHQISQYIKEVEKTNLTEQESFYLKELSNKIESIAVVGRDESICYDQIQGLISNELSEAKFDLDLLAEIQLEEGRKMVNDSEKIVLSSGIYDRLEVAIVCITLGIIYVLIFADFSGQSKVQKKFTLN